MGQTRISSLTADGIILQNQTHTHLCSHY